MLRLALVFVVIALIAVYFGLTEVSGLSWESTRTVFFIFLVLAVLCFLGGVFRRQSV